MAIVYKQCREGQILDVGDRVLRYRDDSKDKYIMENDVRTLTNLGISISEEITRVTPNDAISERGIRYPRVYGCTFKNRGKVDGGGIKYKPLRFMAFSTK